MYERILSRSNLPAPRFRGNFKTTQGTWLIIDVVEGVRPVTESDFVCLSSTLAVLHNQSEVSARLVRETPELGVPPRYSTACERSLRYLEDLSNSKNQSLASRRLARRLIDLADWLSEAQLIFGSHSGLVHGNLHLGNVLVAARENGGEPRVVLLDWPDIGIGSPLEDLGTLISSVPGRLLLIRDSYAASGGHYFEVTSLTRAFHFQLFVEAAWHAHLAVTSSDPYESRLFNRSARTFGL